MISFGAVLAQRPSSGERFGQVSCSHPDRPGHSLMGAERLGNPGRSSYGLPPITSARTESAMPDDQVPGEPDSSGASIESSYRGVLATSRPDIYVVFAPVGE